MADPRKGKRPSRGKTLLFKGIHGRDFRVRPGEVGWDIDIREPGGEFQPGGQSVRLLRRPVAIVSTRVIVLSKSVLEYFRCPRPSSE